MFKMCIRDRLISVVIFAGALALYIVLRRRCCVQGKSADK